MIIEIECGHSLDTINDVSEELRAIWQKSISELNDEPESSTGPTFDCPICGVEHILTRTSVGIFARNMLNYLNEMYREFTGKDEDGDWFVVEF